MDSVNTTNDLPIKVLKKMQLTKTFSSFLKDFPLHLKSFTKKKGGSQFENVNLRVENFDNRKFEFRLTTVETTYIMCGERLRYLW